jgi:hypothetical protein
LIILASICLLVAFLCLVLASLLPPPAWLFALDATAFSVAGAALFGLAFGLSRPLLRTWSRGLALPGVAAAVAVGLRGSLLSWLSPPEALAQVDYARVQLAALSLVGALFALVSGIAVASRAESVLAIVLSGVVITAALYVAGPVMLRLGVPLDHRTFLGLAGVGVGAYALIETGRKMAEKGKR